MADVKVPGLGNVPKPALIAVGAASASILVYAWWRHKGAANVPQDAAATTPTVSSDTSIDPATGVPYADEYGGYGGFGGYSGIGINDPTTGGIIGGGYGSGVVQTVTTNAAWAQAAQLYLTTVAGFQDSNAVAAALGAVLLGHYVTPDQVTIWNAAVAFEGYPPQGYPPLNTTPPGHGGSTPPPATKLKAPTGVKVSSTTKTTVSLHWNKVTGATHYRIYDNVSSYNIGDSVDTATHIGGLQHNHTYRFHVRAMDAKGHLGPSSASVTAKTKK